MVSETFGIEGLSVDVQEQGVRLCRNYFVHRGWAVEGGVGDSAEAGLAIVAENDGETVLVDVRASEAEDSEAVPQSPKMISSQCAKHASGIF